MAQREGLEPVAHEIAGQLLDHLLPLLPLGEVSPVDVPFVQRILMVAAQVGAGIGTVENRSLETPPGSTDRRVWAVLWISVRDLPTVPPGQRFAAAYLMQAGHYVARTGDGSIPGLVATLRSDVGAAPH